jgi:P4 family phage/plasmid primase-like protien
VTTGQSLLLQRLQPYKLRAAGPNKCTFFSPLREEKKPSGTLTFDGDNVLLYDFGDETEGAADRILDALGLTWPDVLPSRDNPIPKPARHDEKDAWKRARAAAKAGQLWTAGTKPGADQPYLQRKGLAPVETLREIDQPAAASILGYPPKLSNDELLTGRLLIAPIEVGAKLSTVELIDGSGRKCALFGGQKAGGYWASEELPAGDGEGLTFLIGEGVATCLSGHTATGYLAIAALSCGNLAAVGKYIRGRYWKAKIVFLADLGVGVTKSTEAARAVAGFVAVPDFGENPPEGTKDINDLHQAQGLEAVKACIEAATKPAPAEPVAPHAVIPAGRDGRRPARAFALTETGGAELLADRLAGDWRYCHERAQWARWAGKVWTFDGGDVAITERSKLVAREFHDEAKWADANDDARAKAFGQFALTAQRRQFRRAVIDLARSEPGILIPFSEFDRDAYLLNCQNGTVDLKTGQLRPHCREDKITRILPWSYDPAATCPRWERFLTEILPDAETVDFVRHAIGYTVTADTSEHVLFSCFGAGANGKSTLFNVLLYLFGPYGTTAPTSMLVAKQHESHPAEKIVLVAKRLVEFQEIPSGQRLNEALVKSLVSGDPDQARGMRENFVEFRPVAKLWLAGNHRLDIREQTDAIWRRYREIPFERAFAEEERDHGLEETLRGEVVGILAWSVRACLEWQRVGLGKSGKVLAATADFRAEADRLGPFLGERCAVAPSATVPRAALYREYCAWAEAQGDRHPLGERQFADLLRGRGFGACWTRSNGKQCRGWRGLELATNNTNNTFPPDSRLPPISFLSREGSGKTGGNVLSPVVGDPDGEEIS